MEQRSNKWCVLETDVRSGIAEQVLRTRYYGTGITEQVSCAGSGEYRGRTPCITRPLRGYPMRSARMGRAQDSGDRPAPGGSKAPPSNSWPLVSPFCPPASACSSPKSIPGTRQNLPVARVCGVVLFVFLCPYFYLCLFLCLCLRMVMPMDTP